MAATAYQVLTARLLIRCFDPADAPELCEVIASNREHLAEMPWIRHEPPTVDRKMALLRGFRADFDLDRNHSYGIFDRTNGRLVGATGLHPRVGEGAREIGYWIARERAGAGLATEAAGALTRVGFEVGGLGRIEIHCAPHNRGSARVAEKLGYRYEATLRARTEDSTGQLRDVMIWSVLADEYAATPAARLAVEAFDAIGRRLL